MITKADATNLKIEYRNCRWGGEDFAAAVIRMDKSIRESAESGADGVCDCFNPKHVPALLVILHAYGFTDAKVNCKDNFRIDIHW